MSKYVKQLITSDINKRLDGVDEALLVNVIGLDANSTAVLRKDLRSKGMSLMVIKNSLARRAAEGTPLAPGFDGSKGTLALLWGGEDIISLAKEATRLNDSEDFEAFKTRGGVSEGEVLSPQEVKAMSKWPTRDEQLSLLVGQLLGPGSALCGALLGPGGAVASQIESKSKE